MLELLDFLLVLQLLGCLPQNLKGFLCLQAHQAVRSESCTQRKASLEVLEHYPGCRFCMPRSTKQLLVQEGHRTALGAGSHCGQSKPRCNARA